MEDHYRKSGSGRYTNRSQNAAGGKHRSTGSSYPGNGYYRRQMKKRRERRSRMMILAAVICLLTLFGIIAARRYIRKNSLSSSPSPAADSGAAAAETKLKTTVTINDVDITGKSKADAEKAVLAKFSWGMTAKLDSASADSAATTKAAAKSSDAKSGSSKSGDADSADPKVYKLNDLLKVKLEKILTEIYDKSGKPKESYVIDSSDMDTEIAAETAAMAKKWNKSSKNGAISGYDKSSGAFTYTDSVDGVAVDEDALKTDIKSAMDKQDYSAVIAVKASIKKAELSKEAAKEKYKVIGTFTTKATANADRNNNLTLACAAIDGMILQKNDEFSFNNTTGNRTVEKGYKPAGAYQNGKVVLEPGGGVCQVSSTLYNAVIAAGIQPTERHAHTFAPTYVTPGEDATVSYDGYAGPDMRFVNTSESAIAIRASFQNLTVTVSVIGIPILEDGVTVSMHSEKTDDYDNASTEYIEDPTMVPGEEKQIDEGTKGSRWVTNLVTKKNGKVVSDVFYHTSTYKGHSKKIARNTSGVQQTGGSTETLTITENTDTAPEQGGSTAASSAAAKTTAGTVEGKTESGKTSAAATAEATAAETTKSGSSATTSAAASTTKAAETVETIPPNPGG